MSSRSINKVTLLGNLTRDPELKYTPNNTAVCQFGVATNRSWVTAEGQTKEETQYHRIIAWQKLAELCSKLLTKGRKIYLEGRLTYREYVDKNSVTRNITEIVMEDFIIFSDSGKTATVEKEAPAVMEEPAKISSLQSNSDDVNPDDIPF